MAINGLILTSKVRLQQKVRNYSKKYPPKARKTHPKGSEAADVTDTSHNQVVYLSDFLGLFERSLVLFMKSVLQSEV
jgi:hypothetical protein